MTRPAELAPKRVWLDEADCERLNRASLRRCGASWAR